MNKSLPKNSCVWCGTAPINHRVQFISSCINLIPTLLFPVPTSTGPLFLQIQRSPIARLVSRYLIDICEVIGIVRFSATVDEAFSDRTKVIWEEAVRRGVRMEQLIVLGLKRDEMRARLPSKKGSTRLAWEYFTSIPIPPWVSQEVAPWIDDKEAFKAMFRKHRLPVADGSAVLTARGALRLFARLTPPVITKPRDGSRARHTTVTIQTEEELREGFRRAHQLSPFVMVEEFISGTLYRATCVDRKLIGVVEFIKPCITADGVQTVEQLRVSHNNNKRFPNLTDVQADSWYIDAIQHQGLTLESVPIAGTPVLLSEHSERPNGGYFIDITDSIPPSTKETIEEAARLCNAEVLGFDIISKNLTDEKVPFTFIEGNTLPYIELHHIPYEGKPRDTAGAVWDMWGMEKS